MHIRTRYASLHVDPVRRGLFVLVRLGTLVWRIWFTRHFHWRQVTTPARTLVPW